MQNPVYIIEKCKYCKWGSETFCQLSLPLTTRYNMTRMFLLWWNALWQWSRVWNVFPTTKWSTSGVCVHPFRHTRLLDIVLINCWFQFTLAMKSIDECKRFKSSHPGSSLGLAPLGSRHRAPRALDAIESSCSCRCKLMGLTTSYCDLHCAT